MNGIEEQKEHKFKFKSKKGQEVELVYKPEYPVVVNNESEFQPYIEHIVNFLQCTDYKAKKIKREVAPAKTPAKRKRAKRKTPAPKPSSSALGVDDV